MKKAEIQALVCAHRGRVQPVAFLHVLRQPVLEADDQAFLSEHATKLSSVDLLRWQARCATGTTGPVLEQFARIAVEDPEQFNHEILPRLSLQPTERRDLAKLLEGKVSPQIWRRIVSDESKQRQGDGASAIAETAISSGSHAAGQVEESFDIASIFPADDWEEHPAWLHGPGTAGDATPEQLTQELLLERARAATGTELLELLQQLEPRGVPRKVLLGIALQSLHPAMPAADAEKPLAPGMPVWLARQFTTRSAWDNHGLELVLAFLGRRAFPELHELIALVWNEAGRAGELIAVVWNEAGQAGDVPQGFLEAVHASFALALVHATREALGSGESPRAMAALSALACLDPPSRVSRSIHDLGRAPGMTDEVRDLFEVNLRLVKHSNGRDASLEGIVAAIHALADAFA